MLHDGLSQSRDVNFIYVLYCICAAGFVLYCVYAAGSSRQSYITTSSVSLPSGSDAPKSRSLPMKASQSEMSLTGEEKLSQGGSSSTTGLSMTSHE